MNQRKEEEDQRIGSAAPDRAFTLQVEELKRAVDLLAEYRSGERQADSLLDYRKRLPDLPEEGIGDCAALEELAPWFVGGSVRLGDPGFFAHMDPPTPWAAWAAAMWAASLNQNLLHPDVAPVAREVESLVVGWLAPFFGMDGGHMTPGSSVANLTALWAARETRGVEEVVASSSAHLSVRKAAHVLGLKFTPIPARADGRLDEGKLGDLSRSALVLTAGTTSTGAIDALDAGPKAAWRHVDAAWAGPLRLSDRHALLLEGIDKADSVAVSAHKWLFQPKESALVFFARTEEAHAALSFGGGYLAVPNIGLLGSHGATAFPLMATLLAWGRKGMAERIDRCMKLATSLAQLIKSDERLELYCEPQSGVVIWRPRFCDARRARARLQSSFVSLTTIDGIEWFRSVGANPMADPERVLRDVFTAIESCQREELR